MANARAEAVVALEARLGHAFRDHALLERALTHASVSEGAPPGAHGARDNERLEFLGDRILGLLTAERLFRDFPAADEGQLSSSLHALVDKAACAKVGEAWGVGAALRLSAGETKTGGRRKAGVIADAVEAILAAVYLDGGLEAARGVYERGWAGDLAAPPPRSLTNPKSALQEWAQGQGRPLPAYRVAQRTGSDHAPTFTVEVTVQGVEPLTAQGRSRQEAEKAAATALLKREGVI
ncbi:MAG: ribonuclease III [Brevundimonas sp.]|uniref:Ribonuclease 3 n=1 Tax=Brevundimonas albigilva TaxID=1312364 RepID=A0ABY4SRJ8_9CAUL|nr:MULTISPECIES: ribonuclease III [Brevundimonas]MCV0413721.1 ribonuclease III [Brevundimonas sp.]PZU58729.1 MAG: ribonuclease III [Brevundimonas sp.]UQV18326.1 ribonuclease III [Brevundimonas albigilva]URI16815.1 ribonuclease III [Brevundimonas albigilva]